MAKVTKATVKSMITRGMKSGNLYINRKSEFDGMVDGCVQQKGGWVPAKKTDINQEHTFGVEVIWFVGNSRDYFSEPEFDTDGKLIQVCVYNCCGHFVLKIGK